MEPDHEDKSPQSLGDDPVLGMALVVELQRVIGERSVTNGEFKFQWLLSVSDLTEVLRLLRDAPSGLGLPGLERLLQERLGSLSDLKRVQEGFDDPDV